MAASGAIRVIHVLVRLSAPRYLVAGLKWIQLTGGDDGFLHGAALRAHNILILSDVPRLILALMVCKVSQTSGICLSSLDISRVKITDAGARRR